MSEHTVTIVDIDVALREGPPCGSHAGVAAGRGHRRRRHARANIHRDWLRSIGGDAASPLVARTGSSTGSPDVARPAIRRCGATFSELDGDRCRTAGVPRRRAWHRRPMRHCGATRPIAARHGAMRSRIGTRAATAHFVAMPAMSWRRCATEVRAVWAFGNLGFRLPRWILRPDSLRNSSGGLDRDTCLYPSVMGWGDESTAPPPDGLYGAE